MNPLRHNDQHHHRHLPAVAAARPRTVGMVGLANIGIAAVALLCLLYYVVQVNSMASQTWRIGDARARLASLRAERDTIVARQSELDDRTVLMGLAAQSGMVPSGTVVYLVQDSAVAAR
jgi:hypothetical protein